MATIKTIVGKTPNGGVSSVIYFQNADGEDVDEGVATNAMIIELDAEGKQLGRTYGTIRKKTDNVGGNNAWTSIPDQL